MSQFIPILPFKTGLDLYDQPEVSPDDSASELLDMIPFRGVMLKRDGTISLIRPVAISIDDITQAPNGVVTTLVPHGFITGDQVLISGVGGMIEINDPTIQPFTITVLTPTTFELNYNTSTFTAYTAGGVVSLTPFLGPVGITNITATNPAQVTTLTPHTLTSGQTVFIINVLGPTDINSLTTFYIVTVTGSNTFTIPFNGAPLTIVDITQAPNGIVTTDAPHGLQTGDQINISGVLGMVEVNNPAIQPFTITVLTPTSFELNVDTSAFTPYVSGGISGLAYISGGTVLQPIQGLPTRLTPDFLKDLIAFNQSQAFLYAQGSGQFVNISGTTTWTGDDSRFFWGLNYAGSFWATNNFDPVRYYISGMTWTDFRPILRADPFSQSLGPGLVPATAVSWGPFFAQHPPIIPNSVEIQLSGGSTGALNETITDNGVGVLAGTNGSSGTVNYTTGEVNITVLTPDPMNDRSISIEYESANYRLERALMIFSYKDRVVALFTTEGETFTQYPQRCRYSQNGTPYVESVTPAGVPFNVDAWREDIPGRGGFIDAPTGERIITAGFVRDVLVVLFEFSVWRLRYTGNEIIPFTWERIKTTQGAESTYSVVEFDEGILTVGRTGILMSDTNSSKRIDMIIPDQIFQITNINNAQRRVAGIRDFVRQFAYWSYPEGAAQHFPNRTLTYNYIENSWGIYRQNFTAFGHFQSDTSLTWQEAVWSWQEETSQWQSGDLSAGYPIVVAGNPFGQVFIIEKDYTSDEGIPFNFAWLTKKFNPFFSQGMQCKAIYMFLLVAGTDAGQFTIEHFIDEDVDNPVAIYIVNTNSNGQEKVWRRIPLLAVQAQYQQFRFTFSQDQMDEGEIPLKDVEIYQLILELAPSGRLNYGIGEF